MTETQYHPDTPADAIDAMIQMGSGPEPSFDVVMRDFLWEGNLSLNRNRERGGLLDFASLGVRNPWLYRLEFRTRGLVRDGDGEITTIDRHIVALRFPPDYLRNADRFAMLRLIEPGGFKAGLRDACNGSDAGGSQGTCFAGNQIGIHAVCQSVNKESDDDPSTRPTQASFRRCLIAEHPSNLPSHP